MGYHSRHQVTHPPRGAGRHPRRAAWWTAGVAVAVLGTIAVATVSGPGAPTMATSSCSAGDQPLTVVASPDIAPVVTTVIRLMASGEASGTSSRDDTEGNTACPHPVVRAADPADTVAALASNAADRPDVWIPDSSAWTTRLSVPGTGVAVDNPSVTSSPYVLAVPSPVATPLHAASTLLHVRDVLPGASGSNAPLRWAFPDPTRSISSAAALVALLDDLTGTPGEAASLTALVRAANVDVGTGLDDTLARTGAAPTAVPTTEQQAFVHNRDHEGSPVALAYGDKTSLAADYPFVILSTERSRRLQATSLLTALTGELGRRLLAANGFRDVSGIPGAVLTAQPGIDRATLAPQKPSAAAVQRATTALSALRRGSRLLAVVDVSGSMATEVPGARGASRLDLALTALTTGLAVYPDDTVAGLWTFSTNLTPTTDYRVLVPPVVLGTGPDGASGRARLAQALAGVRVAPEGDTGLYDTVLAAVRMMRASWDPRRVNSVVIVTDGANVDPQGIDLTTLLRTLAAERDDTRPVAVFAIAYGPAADVGPLRQITAAAGGTVYEARDPRTIGAVLADAIGRRACTPACS